MTASPPARVVLRVLSPMLIAGGSAGGSPADVDVLTDEHGLPYIPKSRLISRLRDAALIAIGAIRDPELTVAAFDVLGRTGASGPSSRPRILLPSDARLPATLRATVAASIAARTDDSVKGRRYQFGAAALIEAITNALTDVEFNTAITRGGAPSPGTLHTARVVRPGVSFIADLQWTTPPEPRHVRVLALAVLGLRQLGARESDGRGHVAAHLDPDRAGTMSLAGLPPAGANPTGIAS
jgi:hypothetical protein